MSNVNFALFAFPYLTLPSFYHSKAFAGWGPFYQYLVCVLAK